MPDRQQAAAVTDSGTPASRGAAYRGRRRLIRAAFLGAAGFAIVLVVVIAILALTHATAVSYVGALRGESVPGTSDPLFARTMELYIGTPLREGNRVELLLNGDGTYPALWADLRSAESTITVQVYYSQPGAVADSMQSILMERARSGVRVYVLLDGFGSRPLGIEWVRSLERAGATVAWLRPVRWYTLHRATNRSHVRAIVVDGRVGYTGGFGLADYWLGAGRSGSEWRETNVRFTGPAVAQLQVAFAEAWAEGTGRLIVGSSFFPPCSYAMTCHDDAGGGTLAEVAATGVNPPAVSVREAALLHTVPTHGSTTAERFLALSIAAARRTLYVSNSYFVPDADFTALLLRSAARGVDVRVLTAGDSTDVMTTLHAGRARYEVLLRGGVRVYEYQPTMMHAKTFVIDGSWSTVGSMNFDNRSMVMNDESNLVVLDERLGAQLDSIFLEDLRHAREITLEEHLARSWWQRMKEVVANVLSRVL